MALVRAALRNANPARINLLMSQIDVRPQSSTSFASTADFAEARSQMVDTQIRPVQVNDTRIIKAMRELPRERFVPAALASFAYADRCVKLSGGRVLMEPLIIARMLQVATPRTGEKALVVAAGTGYAAVLLAMLELDVVALEQDAALAAEGARICSELAPRVRFEVGPLAAGWEPSAPYDLIAIDGAVRALPEALGGQLAPSGRVVAVLWPEGGVGTAVLAELSTHGLRARPQFDATTPLIPELAPAPGFSF
jgi:protein-L-isoaspartate(D-aspartate) O-methyltransferase